MDNYLEPRLLCMELLKSIREYEARIDELTIALDCQDGVIENERRIKVLTRLRCIIDTREKLIESFHTISDASKLKSLGKDSTNPFDNITAKYTDLKNVVKQLLDELEEIQSVS